MTTSGLAYFENKPQDQQQLHGGNFFGKIKKFYMTFLIKRYFICWNGLYFEIYLLRKCSITIYWETVVRCVKPIHQYRQ